MESLFIAFILMIITFTTKSFPFAPLWSTSPSPTGCSCCFFFFSQVYWDGGEVHRPAAPLRGSERTYVKACSFPSSLFPSLHLESVGVSTHISKSFTGSAAAPMTANWGWTSTAGWGSGCRPPRWVRPSWRCGCPDRGYCPRGEASSWTQSAPISGDTQRFHGINATSTVLNSASNGVNVLW